MLVMVTDQVIGEDHREMISIWFIVEMTTKWIVREKIRSNWDKDDQLAWVINIIIGEGETGKTINKGKKRYTLGWSWQLKQCKKGLRNIYQL